jgi:hypothetical protein
MQMSADIYSKLTKVQPTMFDPKADVVAAGTTAEFWNDTDTMKHNYAQGLAVYLAYLEAFHASCGAGAGKYMYTSSGVTVGLWVAFFLQGRVVIHGRPVGVGR